MPVKYLWMFVILAVFLAACSAATPPPTVAEIPVQSEPTAAETLPEPTPVSTTVPQVPAQPTAAVEQAAPQQESAPAAYNGPSWAALPIVDSRTGATFTLADFAGKTVFVEPMATWCTNCRYQLPNVTVAKNQLDPEQYVFVSFSVGENVDNATLATYADEQGWDWIFAVASEEITQGMVDSFGFTVVSPPSTPHFIIRADGSLTEIATGSHSSDELVAELQAASGA